MAAGVAAAAGAGTAAGAAATADVDDGFVLMTGGSGAEEEGEELEGEATERAGEPDAGACMDALLQRLEVTLKRSAVYWFLDVLLWSE